LWTLYGWVWYCDAKVVKPPVDTSFDFIMPTAKKTKPKAPAATTKSAKPAKAAKPAKPKAAAAKGASAKGASAKEEKGKRKMGLRGAAPWAARHAAKHAEEARARAAQPPLPGSARATIRTPTGAEDIKAKIGALHTALAQIKQLRKSLHKTFWDIALVLRDVQARKLYEAKGFGNFDAFLDREIDLGKTTSQRIIRITQIFQKEAALEFGMERCINALITLEAIPESTASTMRLDSVAKLPPAPVSTSLLPLRPPGR
jgi:hypothetical protein